MIAFRGINKSFGTVRALGPLDLEVPAGQTCVLIGPSGCGKSTLLRLFLGLLHSESGEIVFEGRVLGQGRSDEFRRKTGYVIQDGGLFPHLTARENATLMARHRTLPSAEIDRRLQELTSLVKLPPSSLDRYPSQLSGGQRQRVGLMRALMLDPEVLLLDEPLGALDPMHRYDLQDDLKNIFSRLKKTVLLVTHDLSEAHFFADRIVLLKDGAIMQEGTLRDFMDHPADEFVTRFVLAQRPTMTAGGGT
jgi:osmoprotectant transport system ATP-binding protein